MDEDLAHEAHVDRVGHVPLNHKVAVDILVKLCTRQTTRLQPYQQAARTFTAQPFQRHCAECPLASSSSPRRCDLRSPPPQSAPSAAPPDGDCAGQMPCVCPLPTGPISPRGANRRPCRSNKTSLASQADRALGNTPIARFHNRSPATGVMLKSCTLTGVDHKVTLTQRIQLARTGWNMTDLSKKITMFP